MNVPKWTTQELFNFQQMDVDAAATAYHPVARPVQLSCPARDTVRTTSTIYTLDVVTVDTVVATLDTVDM